MSSWVCKKLNSVLCDLYKCCLLFFLKKQVFNLFPSGRQELADKADTDLKLYWYWVLEIIVSFGGKGQGQQKDNIISAVVNSLFRVTTWTVLSATSNLKLNSLNHWLEDDWLLHWWFAHQFSAMPELKRAIYVHNRLLTFCKFMKQIIQAMCITQLEGSTTSIHFFYLFLQCSSDMKTEVQIVALIWCLKIETSVTAGLSNFKKASLKMWLHYSFKIIFRLLGGFPPADFKWQCDYKLFLLEYFFSTNI